MKALYLIPLFFIACSEPPSAPEESPYKSFYEIVSLPDWSSCTLDATYQTVDFTISNTFAVYKSDTMTIDIRSKGNEIWFTFPIDTREHTFRGRIQGALITGQFASKVPGMTYIIYSRIFERVQ